MVYSENLFVISSDFSYPSIKMLLKTISGQRRKIVSGDRISSYSAQEQFETFRGWQQAWMDIRTLPSLSCTG